MKRCEKTNKVCYQNYKIAIRELAYNNVLYYSGTYNKLKTRVYYCKFCKQFHLTSKK